MSKGGMPLPYLKAWRTKRALSQPQLADMVGISRHTIIAWEKGRQGPYGPLLAELAHALGITSEELVHVNPIRSGFRKRLIRQSIKPASIRYALDWYRKVS